MAKSAGGVLKRTASHHWHFSIFLPVSIMILQSARA